MEMTYGGALVMPSSYAMMDEEEMMYLEGGVVYSGTQGWAVASVLTAVGWGVGQFAKKTAKACVSYIIGMIAVGPIGWIGAGITVVVGGASLGALAYLAAQFLAAGKEAVECMYTKGSFSLSMTNNIKALFRVY